MTTPKYVSIARAWLRKTLRNAREIDVSLSGPGFKLNFKADEPIETRSGFDPLDKRPFYESDPTTLFNYYHAYANNPEHLDNILYAEILALRTANLHGIALNAVRTEDLVIAIEPSSYRVPEKLRRHGDAVVQFLKDTGKINFNEEMRQWENNVSLRIDSIEPNGRIACRKARYFDQIATNLTMDWATGLLTDGWHTIRSGLERPENGRLRQLMDSTLANTLGVAVMFYERDLSPILRVRSESLASIQKRGLHCTASGVHEVEESQRPGLFDFSILRQGMLKEIKEEIGLDEHEYCLFPVAFARELPRGGKPQLFFAAVSLVESERIRGAMASAKEAYEFVEDQAVIRLPTDGNTQTFSDLFTYEGWACFRFAERFIEANRDYLESLALQDA